MDKFIQEVKVVGSKDSKEVSEITISFEDGWYTLRKEHIGDSICGSSAHDYMYAMDDFFKEKRNDATIVQRFTFILSNSTGPIAEIWSNYSVVNIFN